ncbi:hypothetical protein F5148DRAFT_1264437 [Russula earlei]|uniref:Uncharacterized protein n=1 Tax=Russula earlei TaxID=71964 RepID=A0ACC0TRN9_9AGAM|nr:hypothetical protein F5148DRAFT_1264437 [Russula earlei]
MHISVFAIFCLAVGIAPSLALPSGQGNPGLYRDSQGRVPSYYASPSRFVPGEISWEEYMDDRKKTRREAKRLEEKKAREREASEASEAEKSNRRTSPPL